MSKLLSFYHKLPLPMRELAATLRGYYLRSWRYGKHTSKLLEQAAEREHWSQTQWQAWQEARLAYILRIAATTVPYYENFWAHRRRNGDRRSWEYLENWPVLKKENLREHNRLFVAKHRSSHKLFEDHTSGTTGTPLNTYIAGDTLRQWYALFEARTRHWHGVSMKDHWVIMGGQMVIPFHQNKPPYGVRNYALNQLYLSTHHISNDSVIWYAEALRSFAPTHMIVYPSSAFLLATLAREQNITLPPVRVIFSNAEKLQEHQKNLISEVFQCPVVDTYGMGEYAFAASECQQGSMHIWPEIGLLEVMHIDDDKPVDPSENGRFIVTSLLNEDMPLIRYEVGDLGNSLGNVECACGRTLSRIGQIEGRLNDMLYTRDGRQIFWLNPIFYGLSIREAQIVQESLDQITVNYLPSPAFRWEDEEVIRSRIQMRTGIVEVTINPVQSIPRDKNGKFRAVISKCRQ